MLKKGLLFTLFALSLIFLAACGRSESAVDYVEVSFSGMDTQGMANYDMDTTALIEKIFKLEGAHDYPDAKVAEEANQVLNAYSIKVEPTDNLSNGDKVKVIVTVDEDRTKKIKGGEKEVIVEGLEEPKKLTTEEVEKNLVLNFNGVSGRGVAQIDKVFDEAFLNNLKFEIENDGQLKNGDKAKVIVGKEAEEVLHNNGYVLDEDFNPTVEVKNLDIVAEKATDIKNLKDVERFLDEELKNKYKDTDLQFGSNVKYEIKQEKLMYRQFDKESSDDDSYSRANKKHGNLIGIYSVERYYVGDDKKLDTEFTAIFGFSELLLNEDGQANLAELKQIDERKEKNYSIESVIQLYEGEGYEEVKR